MRLLLFERKEFNHYFVAVMLYELHRWLGSMGAIWLALLDIHFMASQVKVFEYSNLNIAFRISASRTTNSVWMIHFAGLLLHLVLHRKRRTIPYRAAENIAVGIPSTSILTHHMW